MPGVEQPITQQESPYEAARRVSNVLRLGTVAEVRHAAPARCRVQTGDNLTDWLPWLTLRAGGAQDGTAWWPPVVGEQVLLLAPGGDLAQAVAMPGIYSSDMPQGAFDEDVERHDFSSSDFWQHSRSAGTLVVDIAQAITLNVGSSQLHITPSGTTLTTPEHCGQPAKRLYRKRKNWWCAIGHGWRQRRRHLTHSGQLPCRRRQPHAQRQKHWQQPHPPW